MKTFTNSEAFSRLGAALSEIKPLACLTTGCTTFLGTPNAHGFMFMGSRAGELCFKDIETRNYLYLRPGVAPELDTLRIPVEDAPFVRGIFHASPSI